MKAPRTRPEFDIRKPLSSGAAAIPQAAAAVYAFFAFERWNAFCAQRQCLSGAHSDAGLVVAAKAQSDIAKHDVIGEAWHCLYLAAH